MDKRRVGLALVTVTLAVAVGRCPGSHYHRWQRFNIPIISMRETRGSACFELRIHG
jgi:hypothetical protein